MPNPYINKVTANGQTLIDLTADTAVASDVATGKYFHLATGERVVGTASGGGGDTYTLTTIVPQQTFTPQELNGSYQTTVNFTAGIEDGESYLVTFDGEQYLCMCGVMWGSDYMAGKESLFWGDRGDSPYPFGLDYVPSVPEFGVGTYDLDSHTIKVEHIELVDGPLTIIPKSVTANGTYAASSDNADGYSSVTVNVASGGSNDFVVTLSYNSSTGMWEPDCTINELQAAYAGGKNIAFVGEGGEATSWFYDDDYSFVYSIFTSGSGNTSVIKEYWFTTQGISHVDDYQLVSPTGNLAITENGTNIDVAEYATVSVNVSGSSVQTATGTFTGNGTRTIDVACNFEPDIVYVTSDPGTTASSGTVALIIVRDLMAATRYRNNSAANSSYAQPDIVDMNTNGTSYSWRATYANSTVTLYCLSSAARSLLTDSRTYTYTFMKWA